MEYRKPSPRQVCRSLPAGSRQKQAYAAVFRRGLSVSHSIAAFVLLFALLIAACNPSIPPPAPPPKEYSKLVVEKELIRFSFEYPNYYEPDPPVLERGISTTVELSLYYPEKEAPTISYFVMYVLYPGGGKWFELDPKLAAEEKLATREPFPGFQLVGRSSRTVAGVAAEEIAYFELQFPVEHRAYGRLYLFRKAFFSWGDQIYRVYWSAPAEAAGSFWGDFDHVLNTFKFLD